jgi:hypothetical protein
VAPPAAERLFLLDVCNRRTVDRRQIRVDDTGLRMRSVTQRFAKQPFGGIGVARRTTGNPWWHLPNSSPGTGSTSGLLPEGTFHRLASTCWSASGAGAVVAITRGRNAAPIARQSYDRLPGRVPPATTQHPEATEKSKIPADRTENERRFCLPPLEDRRTRSHFTILSRCQPGLRKLQHNLERQVEETIC